MRSLVVVLLAITPCLFGQAAPSLPVGLVVDSIPCENDSSQTYALYLPSHYTQEKTWPVIYAFDPLARGKLPVSLFKDSAE
jgi:hypothetical protein